MFGMSTEKKVAREADRIVSMKEDVDALSWGRVLEIGKLLRERAVDDEQSECARELVSIAQSNISLANRLGIDSASPTSGVMASGMEIVEGGYAEAGLRDAVCDEPASIASEEAEPAASEATASVAADEGQRVEEPPSADEPACGGSRVSGEPAVKVAARIGHPPLELPDIELPLPAGPRAGSAAPPAPVKPSAPLAASASTELPFVEAVFPLPADVDAREPIVSASDTDRCPVPVTDERVEQPMSSAEGQGAPAPAVEACDPAPAPDGCAQPISDAEEPAAPVSPSATQPAQTPSESPAEPREPAASEEPDRCAEGEPAPGGAEGAERPRRQVPKERFARFRRLYESQDGGLCVFEDEHGHLVAVDASRLA